MTDTASSWFRSRYAHRQADMRLFCFPYAGGTALIYRGWADHLPSFIQTVSIELPGRGARSKEPLFTSLSPLIDALTKEILPLLNMPFAFFGHSMGALIAFELARSLSRQYGHEPQALVVSGRSAPQLPDDTKPNYDLPRDGFLEEVRRLNGTHEDILANSELMEMVIPLLRADFQLVQTYEYFPGRPLSCPIIAYGGLQDYETPREKLAPWKEHTRSNFSLHMFPGDHFFLQSSQTLLAELLSRELCEIGARSRVLDIGEKRPLPQGRRSWKDDL